MTKTVKKAIETMKICSPYKENQSQERKDVYHKLWHSMQTLRKLNIISYEEWNAIFELDHKMYIDAE